MGLGQVSENKLGFHFRIFGAEISNSFLYFFLRGKSIEDNIESFGSEGVGDAESNTTERASDEGDFVVVSEC